MKPKDDRYNDVCATCGHFDGEHYQLLGECMMQGCNCKKFQYKRREKA